MDTMDKKKTKQMTLNIKHELECEICGKTSGIVPFRIPDACPDFISGEMSQLASGQLIEVFLSDPNLNGESRLATLCIECAYGNLSLCECGHHNTFRGVPRFHYSHDRHADVPNAIYFYRMHRGPGWSFPRYDCTHCLINYWAECYNCGDFQRKESMIGDFCPDCAEDEDDEDNDDYYDDDCVNYGYFEDLKWKGTQGKHRERPWLGIELEVDREDRDRNETYIDTVDSINHIAGSKIVLSKEDGSLDHGFELNFSPLTFDWINENRNVFNPIWELKDHEWQGTEGCDAGLHIHLSENTIGNLQLLKMYRWFWLNREYLKELGGRNESSFRAWSETDSCDIPHRARRKDYGGKSSAINCATGIDTIELRCFKSHVTPDGFFRCIEFAQAFYEFTKTESLSSFKSIKTNESSALALDLFIMYVRGNKKRFPCLCEFNKSYTNGGAQ